MNRLFRRTVLHALLLVGLILEPTVSQGAVSSTTLQARLVAGYLLAVQVSIDGRGPWDFVVDTGTNETIIDDELAGELRLDTSIPAVVNTLAGQESVSVARVKSIAVGSWEVRDLEVAVDRIETLRGLDARVRGILGLDYLYHFAFSLDYEHSRLRMYSAGTLEDPQNTRGTKVDLRLVDGRLLVPCAWRGAAEHLLALDSGIARVLLFQEPGADLNTSAARMEISTNAASTGGTRMELRSLVVGGQRLRDAEAVLMKRTDAMKALREEGVLPTTVFRSIFVNPRAQVAVFVPK